MAQRLRSRARRDPDLDEDSGVGGSPPSRHSRRGGSGEEEDDDVGNEDLSLEIVARARRRRRKRRGESGGGGPGLADLLQVSSGDEAEAAGRPAHADLLQVSSGDEEAGEDAVVELGEAEVSRRKQRKKQRKRQRKKHRKEAAEAAAAAVDGADEEQQEVSLSWFSDVFSMSDVFDSGPRWHVWFSDFSYAIPDRIKVELGAV